MLEESPVPEKAVLESPEVSIPPKPATLPDRAWHFYLGFLVVAGLGLLATRSGIFSLLILLVTLGYAGLQISQKLFQVQTSATVVTMPRFGALYGTAVTLLAALAIFLMAAAAYMLKPSTADLNLLFPFLMMLAGGLVLLIAIFIYHLNTNSEKPVFIFYALSEALPKNQRLVTTLGILLLFTEAEITGNSFKIPGFQGVSFWIQALLFWGGVVLVAIGLSGDIGIAWLQKTVQKIRSLDFHTIAFIVVILLALVLRVIWLESSLPLAMDDGSNIPGMWAVLGDRPAVGLVGNADNHYTTQLYAQFLVISIKVFGGGFTGLRLVDSLFGTLNIVSVYLLASALFNRKMALIAALVLATFPPHLHFSRLIFAHIIDATFGTFAIAFLVRAMKHNRRPDWALAGVSLGLTQYFFEAGRLFYPPLIGIWLGILIIFNFKNFKHLWPGLGVFVTGAILVAIPTYYAIFAQNVAATSRINVSGVGLNFWVGLWNSGDMGAFIRRLTLPFLVYLHQPETGLVYYGGTNALILEYVAPFFLLGVFYTLWWWRKPAIVIAVWLFAASGANLLMLDSANYTRFIVAYPAIGLAIAAGLYYPLSLLLNRFPQRIATACIGLVVGLLCISQTVYYFNDHLPALRNQMRMSARTPDSMDAMIRSVNFPPHTHVFLISTVQVDMDIPSVVYYMYVFDKPEIPQFTALSVSQINSSFLDALEPATSFEFFVEPGHPEVIATLSQKFVLSAPLNTQAPDMPPGKGFILYHATPINTPAPPAK